MRTLDGGITTYVRVRARTAALAADKAEQLAYRRHRHTTEPRRYRRIEWFTIYVGIHTSDMNKIDQ